MSAMTHTTFELNPLGSIRSNRSRRVADSRQVAEFEREISKKLYITAETDALSD